MPGVTEFTQGAQKEEEARNQRCLQGWWSDWAQRRGTPLKQKSREAGEGGVCVCACNRSTQEVETGGSGLQGCPQPQGKVKATLGFMRPCPLPQIKREKKGGGRYGERATEIEERQESAEDDMGNRGKREVIATHGEGWQRTGRGGGRQQ